MKKHGLHTVVFACLLIGCSQNNSAPETPTQSETEFLEQLASNRDDIDRLDFEFRDTFGGTVRLQDYQQEQNVLLVFLRGFSGICPHCSSQTSGLIKNYEKIQQRDTEVLLVYPGTRDNVDSFTKFALSKEALQEFPFPILLDENLKVVNELGIADDLAFPSTFIIDKQGNVTLVYVGKNQADRPTIESILKHLDSINE